MTPSKDKTSAKPNEGEGNRTAARAYNKAATTFAKSGPVEKQAQAAKRAVEGPENASLKRAEQSGKAHAKGEDPAVKGTRIASAKA
jgi:hypothetical protein